MDAKWIMGRWKKSARWRSNGYAPDLNPDELVWSYAKRTGNARRPLQKGEKLEERVHAQLAEIGKHPALIRSFFKHPSVAYISAH